MLAGSREHPGHTLPPAEAFRYFIREHGEAFLAKHFAHGNDRAAVRGRTDVTTRNR